jgi:drug/metabolite transporter (DMT)-like permease
VTTTAPATRPVADSTTVDVRTGLPIALCSAAAFALSGSLASSLLVTGWSPAAVVAARVGGAFLALLIPCLLLLRRVGLPTGRATGRMVVYGVVAVAGAQLCYFSAVQHLSVGVALLLEYLAPVLLIGFFWWRRGQRPTAAKLVGAALAMAGLVLVLDLTGDVRISLVGVAWGLGAALCLCVYFVLSESSSSSSPALLLTTVGTGVGAVVLVLAGVIGIVPLAVAAAPVTIAATSHDDAVVGADRRSGSGVGRTGVRDRDRGGPPSRQLDRLVRGVVGSDPGRDLRGPAAGPDPDAHPGGRRGLDPGRHRYGAGTTGDVASGATVSVSMRRAGSMDSAPATAPTAVRPRIT